MTVGHDGKRTKAIYFDGEEVAINYSVNFSNDPLSIIFADEALAGEPEEFSMYIDGIITKKCER